MPKLKCRSLFLSAGLAMMCVLQARSGKTDLEADPSVTPPLYEISFEREDPVQGLDSPAIRLPFQCTSDGTIFIGMIRPPDASKEIVASISPSRDSHLFLLDQVPDLRDKEEIDHYAADSQVIFLVRAALEDKIVHGKVVTSSGAEVSATRNAAERHLFIVAFDRDGKYKKTTQVDDAFHVERIGVFPTGLFLAYGWDELTHKPDLALLKEDGTILQYLSPPAKSQPDSAFDSGGNKKGPGVFVSPVQFVRHGQSIVVLRMRTELPLLEVDESGALRLIPIHFPLGTKIDMLVPSDQNIYARAGEKKTTSMYEIDFSSGEILGRFQVDNGGGGANIACVHEGKFLSFESAQGAIIPLVGKRQARSVEGTDSESSPVRVPAANTR